MKLDFKIWAKLPCLTRNPIMKSPLFSIKDIDTVGAAS
jgi:hypothetical protein